jgi:glycosyltransferase involved in cell wall biosynthesis
MARELGRLLDDPTRRAELVRAGRRQFASFSWARAARETLASYELALAAA